MAKDDWLEQYARAKEMCDEMMVSLQERQKIQQKGGGQTELATKTLQIRTKMEQLSARIAALDTQLSVADSKSIPGRERELSRRRDMLSVISNRRDEMLSSVRITNSTAAFQQRDRSSLFNDATAPLALAAETEKTRSLDARDLLQAQTKRMEEQDDALDELSRSVLRTKKIGESINDELNEHSRLLGDIELEPTESKAGWIRHKRGFFMLWVCLAKDALTVH
eukprot:CAMPEP_0184649158 /NCGR_PEP_ID=MMETSP0308-20130426/6435_1 /TAXON_ID=38269 /ORGANISM="Gloeochaete witrockiana, Strain SAG 46.84" /LENGTH=222 /DNA_ID=CAMNT_0027081617 /DNA_START=130 /DNA_END=799 /DNA_ORIENTATION=-